jgi:Transglutaminase-like superfamily
MVTKPQQIGWRLHHHEQLFIHANSGAPTIRLKFYHYPPYRQTVLLNQPPAHCKLKHKKDNTFFLFSKKVRTKTTISLERIISIYPTLSTPPPHQSWGRISDIPRTLQRKYKQSFTYWPIDSPSLQEISQESWFDTDDLASWMHATYTYITKTIQYPEKQDKRHGAESVLRTRTGDCDEFTDLFITLARIRGLPSRRLTGYFIHPETGEPEPHAWAELHSPLQGWIPIDIALHNIGNHTMHYVIGKIEEFNPSLLDYQILQENLAVHYHWEQPPPLVTPLFEK